MDEKGLGRDEKLGYRKQKQNGKPNFGRINVGSYIKRNLKKAALSKMNSGRRAQGDQR